MTNRVTLGAFVAAMVVVILILGVAMKRKQEGLASLMNSALDRGLVSMHEHLSSAKLISSPIDLAVLAASLKRELRERRFLPSFVEAANVLIPGVPNSMSTNGFLFVVKLDDGYVAALTADGLRRAISSAELNKWSREVSSVSLSSSVP